MKTTERMPENNATSKENTSNISNIASDSANKAELKTKKKKQRKKLPKPVKIGMICAIIGVIVFGIVYVLIQVRAQHSKAYVESVSDLNMGAYDDTAKTFDGTITDEDAQTIPVDSTKTVSKVYVQAGDEVKKGTPLLSYDENEANLQLQSDQESLADLKAKLEMEQKLLDYYNGLTPIADPLTKEQQKKQDELDKKADEQYEKDLEKNYPELQITDVPDNTIYTNTLDTLSIHLQAGKSYKVNVKAAQSENSVEDSSASNWYTDEKSIATVEDGTITAVKGHQIPVTISAEGMSDPVYVNVVSDVPELCAVKLNKYRLDMPCSGSEKIIPTAYAGSDTPVSQNNGSGNEAAPSGLGKAITGGVTYAFSSSDDTIASVSSDGTVTGIAEGEAVITVKASFSGMMASSSAIVEVQNNVVYPDVQSVTLSENVLNLDLTDDRKMSKHIGAKVAPENAKIDKIEWKSSDDKIATVEDGYITGLKEGIATITLTVNDKQATCLVTVSGESKGEILTVSEKEAKIKDINSEIKSINQDIKSTEAAINSDKQAINDLTVTSLVDGVVKTVSDPATPPNDGSPFLSIGSENGVSVSFYIDEYSYPDIHTGDKFTVTNYMNGQSADAVVTYISDYPAEDYQGYGGGVQMSYYKATAYLDNGDGFNVDDSVSVMQASEDTGTTPIVLQKVYVRKDSKGSYVMIDDGKGRLKRQAVTTKKTSDSESVEITSGLTEDDLVAFPYGERAKAGTLTTTEYQTNLLGL